jgi:hypothetical protein
MSYINVYGTVTDFSWSGVMITFNMEHNIW